jgi:stage V sporulation protein T
MKATGIVRRIDDLGRVVIPKEIRRTMRIREGDPLEMLVSDEGIVVKPYLDNATREVSDLLDEISNSQIDGMNPAEQTALKALLAHYLEIKKGEG